ncbi:MAG: hypothetical protein MJZ20_05530 [Bacteroidaceae bacterium]|nr:hypothetical protein [Bacteroidaceae bacterium]
MKKLLLFFFLCFSAMLLVNMGCTKDEEEIDPDAPENKEEVRGIYPPSEDSTVVIVNDEVPDDGK